MSFSRDYLVESLQKYVCEIAFTKVDGSKRIMKCTLLQSYLPEEYQNRGAFLSEHGENNISVWDVEANSWRSFRTESVSSIKILPEKLKDFRNLLI